MNFVEQLKRSVITNNNRLVIIIEWYLGRQKLLLNFSGTCLRCKQSRTRPASFSKNGLPGESVIQSKSGRWQQERKTRGERGNSDTPARATADSLTADRAAGGGDSGLLSWAGVYVGNERM